MQFKLDENLPPPAADLLRSLGHDVMTVYDQGLQSLYRSRGAGGVPGRGQDSAFSRLGLLKHLGISTRAVRRAHRASFAQARAESGLEPVEACRTPRGHGPRSWAAFGSRMNIEFAFD